jgi:hypothetical protein
MLLADMREIYNDQYVQLQSDEEIILNTYLLSMFLYEGVTIETAIKNNIISQFRKRLCQIINIQMNITKNSPAGEKKLTAQIKKVILLS